MDYSEYKLSKKELVINVVFAIAIIMAVAKLFYGQMYVSIILSPFIYMIMKLRKISLNQKRKKALKIQFKDAILSLADLMNVGYSIENAMRECYREMTLVYGNNSYICRELKEIIKKISINTPIERAFADLASRTDIDDIILFSQIFSVAKRMGGNMSAVIQMVADNISQSIDVEEEIDVVISEKKLEQKVMAFVPMGIIIYMTVASPGFLDIMYETIMGRIIMTICLIVYCAAIYIAERIMNIEM